MTRLNRILLLTLLVSGFFLVYQFHQFRVQNQLVLHPDPVSLSRVDAVLTDQFSVFCREFSQAVTSVLSDSVFIEGVRSGQSEEAIRRLGQGPRETGVVIAPLYGEPVAWTFLTQDLMRRLAGQRPSGRPDLVETSDGCYLIQSVLIGTGSRQWVLTVFRVIGYNNFYHPSDAVPPTLTANWATAFNWKSIPSVHVQPNEKDSTGILALKHEDLKVSLKMGQNGREETLREMTRNSRILQVGLILLTELILILILIASGFSFGFRKNQLVAILIPLIALFGWVHTQIGLWNVLLPVRPDISGGAYMAELTFGLIGDLNAWINLATVMMAMGMMLLVVEFPWSGSRPKKWKLLLWIVISTSLLSLSLVSIQRIINSLVLDGWVTGFPIRLNPGEPALWLLVTSAGFLTGIAALIWVSFKIDHLQWIRSLKGTDQILFLALGGVSFFSVQYLLNDQLAMVWQVLLFSFLWFGFSVWATIRFRLRWKHSLQSWFIYTSLFLQGFIPVFFLLQKANNERLAVLQKNLAVQMADPADGWIYYLMQETAAQVNDPAGKESVDSSQWAYDIWLNSLFSQEWVPVRLRLLTPEGRVFSDWSFRFPPADEEDSLNLATGLSEEDPLSRSGVITRRESTGQPPGLRLRKRLTDETDTLRMVLLIDVQIPDVRPRSVVGDLFGAVAEPTDDFNFTTATYTRGLRTETTLRSVFPVRLNDDILQILARRRAVELIFDRDSRQYSVFLYPDRRQPDRVIAVARQVPTFLWNWNQFSPLLLLVIMSLFALYFLLFITSWVKYRHIRFSFRERVFIGIVSASLVLFWGLTVFVEQSFQSQAVNTSKLLLDNYYQGVSQYILTQLREKRLIQPTTGQDYLIYRKRQVWYSTRPDWLKLNLMPDFLPAGIMPGDRISDQARVTYSEHRIRNTRFIVGYYPVPDRSYSDVMVAIPNLLSRQVVEEEIETARSYLVSGYVLFLFFLFTFFSIWINWLLRPIRAIEKAFGRLGRQRDPVYVNVRGIPEIERFANSFNRMVDDLNAYKEAMVRAERQLAWQEMAKQVAHEIKNPLSPLRINTQMLINLYRSDPEKFNQVFEKTSGKILREIETMDRIAKTFAMYSRMPAKNPGPLDIELICREAMDLHKDDRVDFHLTLAGTPGLVLGDREEVGRLLTNLIKNSVQARRLETVSVTIHLNFESPWLTMTLLDNGKGIPEHLLQKVLEPNFSTKSEGMGLGLSICRKIVSDMGGSFRLKSTEGQFTEVSIRLPLIS
ncbi:MAG: ATP-binding protein [Bacteroidetes bacterium]|nr:ATP-binding protein [Bacteroidota bacterium]